MYKIILFIYFTVFICFSNSTTSKSFKVEKLENEGVLEYSLMGHQQFDISINQLSRSGSISFPITYDTGDSDEYIASVNISVSNVEFHIEMSTQSYCVSGWTGESESIFVCPEIDYQDIDCKNIDKDHVDFNEGLFHNATDYPGETHCNLIKVKEYHNCIKSSLGKMGSLYSRAFIRPTEIQIPIFQIINYKWTGILSVSIDTSNLVRYESTEGRLFNTNSNKSINSGSYSYTDDESKKEYKFDKLASLSVTNNSNILHPFFHAYVDLDGIAFD